MLDRRRFVLSSLVAGPLSTWLASPAAAAAYPERAIRMLVGFPAGQTTDTSARRVAQSMTESLGQSVFVDNRPGAAGIISHEAAKNAAPDGYTLLMGSTGTLSINPALYGKLPYDPLRDFEAVTLISASPLVLFTGSESPVRTLQDVIALAKSRPGGVSFGSSGSGTTGHIAMEALNKRLGLKMQHVPYKGSPPMLADVAGGQIELGIDPAGSAFPMAKTGRIRMLGIASLARFPSAPDLPTIHEQGVEGFEAVPWSALVVPRGTPAAIVQRLNEAANVALQTSAVQQQFAATGNVVLGGSAHDAQAHLQKEYARWGQAVADSGAKVD